MGTTGRKRDGPSGERPTAARPRQVLVITYWCWDEALVQTYTLPYVRMMLGVLPPGSTVHLVTLEKGAYKSGAQQREPGIVGHAFRYRPFGLRGSGMLVSLIMALCGMVWRHGIDTVHAWCTPAGMVGYTVSFVTRRPLIIDSYEPHAEAMVENGTWSRNGSAFRVLFFFERLQTRRASAVIAAASGMREYALRTYGIVPKNFHVKPACVDLERFGERNVKRQQLLERYGLVGKLVMVYAGKFGGIYLEQEVFDLIRAARDHWGERLHVLLLTGHDADELTRFMERAGLPKELFTIMQVPHALIPDHIGLGDVALTPVRSVPTKRYCTPIKDGEYWALGLPVIITRFISDDSEIIRAHGIGAVLEECTPECYARAIREVDALLHRYDAAQRFRLIRPVAEKYRHFRIAEAVYQHIYGAAE